MHGEIPLENFPQNTEDHGEERCVYGGPKNRESTWRWFLVSGEEKMKETEGVGTGGGGRGDVEGEEPGSWCFFLRESLLAV